MAIVRDLVTRLGFQVDNRGRANAEGAITRIRDRANDAAMQVRSMLAAFVGFQGLRGLANTADTVQSLEARMAQMTQTAGTAGEAFDEVSRRATAARQDLDAYANLYIRIGNSTQDLIQDQAGLLNVIDTISQAMVVGGVASTEQASAMLQLSQAFNKGKLDGDEFRAVMEAMPRAFTEGLAKAMGFTDGLASFMEASRNGKLTTDALVEALQEIGPSIQSQFLAMPMTISQAMTIVNNRFMTFVARMNRESRAVSRVAEFIVGAFEAIERKSDEFIDKIGGYEQALKLFGIALAAALSPLVLNAFVGAIGLLISPIGLVVAGLTALGLAIEDVYQWMIGGESFIGRFLSSYEDWKAANAELLTSLGNLFDKIKSVWGGIADLGSSFWDLLVGLFTADTDKVTKAFQEVLFSFGKVFTDWVDAAEEYFKLIWKGLGNVAATLWDISPINAWVQKIKGIVPAITSYFKDMISPLTNALDAAGRWLGFGDSDSTSGGAAPVYGPEVPIVPPGGMTNNSTVNQTVNVTVPPGTPEAQRDFIERAARESFSRPLEGMSNNMNIYGR